MSKTDAAAAGAPSPQSPRASLWRNRDYQLLWGSQLVSVLGSTASWIAFPLLILALTNSPEAAGLFGALNTLPLVIFALPAGALVDRWNRKGTMIVCDAARALAFASIFLALWVGHLSLVQIYLVGIVEGTLAIFFQTAEDAALPNVASAEQLPVAVSQNEARAAVASVLGAPLGGFLYGISRFIPFLADAVSYAGSVVALTFVKTPFQQERTSDRANLVKEIVQGLAWLWGQRLIRLSVLLIAGSNFVFSGIGLVLIVLAKQQHASSAVIGTMFAVIGLGGFVGALAAPWLQKFLSYGEAVIGVNWIWALLMPLLAVAPNPIALGGIGAAMLVCGPVYNTIVITYQQLLTPDDLRGRINGAITVIAGIALPLGPGIAGIVMQRYGPKPMVFGFTAFLLALAVIGTLSRDIRKASLTATA